MEQNDINEEIWAACPIDGYEHYFVSDCGRVKNTKTGRIRKASEDKDGYLTFGLCSGGRRLTHRANRLVWMSFFGQIPPGMEVDHIDSNRQNNRLENLQLLTRSENNRKRRPFSEEAKEKMSAAQKARYAARPVSEESKARMSASQKAYFAAHPISDETRARMSAARKAYLARRRAEKSES